VLAREGELNIWKGEERNAASKELGEAKKGSFDD